MLTDIAIWRAQQNLEPKLKDELNRLNEKELFEAFGDDVSFGTGGIRGIMGVGTNRLNIYTIRKASLGFANYIKENLTTRPYSLHNVVVAYDTRNNSRLFAEETARVLASQNIHVWLFEQFRPTPELSFAVRYLRADGGIVITASHNPPEYNGYKVYDENGCQLVPHKADKVGAAIEKIKDIFALKVDSLQDYLARGAITTLEKYFDDKYLTAVRFVSCQKVDQDELKIVYTPLHGTGSAFGAQLLRENGYNVYSVDAQMVPDGNFSTLKSPNPEDPHAFALAVELGHKVGAQLLLATDPDADRVGSGILIGDKYHFLNGNEMAAIMFDYLIKYGVRIRQPVFISTIVTSDLVFEMAKRNNIETIRTLTGFKFICEQIEYIKQDRKDFFFGCEESYGYLISDLVRDKDAFQACLMIAEITAFYQNRDKNLLMVLNDIYREYGFYKEKLLNIKSPGIDGIKNIAAFMDEMRRAKFKKFGGEKILVTEDYFSSRATYCDGRVDNINLPSSDVLKYVFENGWIVFRPSGTEPKLKVYIAVHSDSDAGAKDLLEKTKSAVEKLLSEKGFLQ
ncbi:MAG TPA: phospho-sugar mutase [Bacilli bacterium]|nr:phospho-sugar mutase [Bacilli bacterium]